MSNNKKIISNLDDLKNIQMPTGDEETSAPDSPVPEKTEQKKDFVDRFYANYCEKRAKKAEKKANKQAKTKKFTKGKKIVVGAAAVAILGAIGKFAFDQLAKSGGQCFCEEEGTEEDQDTDFPSEDTDDIQTEDTENETAD